jgi:integrase
MKVLALTAEQRRVAAADEETDARTGVFTSGIVAPGDGHHIALFCTGRQHAGENLATVLAWRAADLAPPIQMCDALAANTAGDFDTLLASCLAHARRRFVEVVDHFPEEVRHVLDTLRDVQCAEAEVRRRRSAQRTRPRPELCQRRLVVPRQRREEQKALDRDQVKTFLSAIEEGHRYPLFLFLARTGARLGEALGLQWQDVDFQKGEIKLVRQITRRRLETLKSGHSRTVDMSDQLSAVLSRHLVAMKEETLRRGWPQVPVWVFASGAGTWLDESRVRKSMRKGLKLAGLPEHFSPHSLRHSYASIMLQGGESIAYVQRQLGHASITLTVNL